MPDTCINIGKYAGTPWTRVPVSYLRWMVNSGHPDAKTAAAEIKRRGTVLPQMEISGHAIDRASTLFINKWRVTRDPDEGIYSWLTRMAELAMKSNQRDEQGRVVHEDMLFAFAEENRWPVLKTVLKNEKYPGKKP